MSNDQIREGYAAPRFEDEDYPELRAFPHSELNRNQQHLWQLSICYYVLAGFFAVCGGGSGFVLVWLEVGPSGLSSAPQNPVLLGFAAFIILFYLALTSALIVAGHSLAVQKRYIFCLVMAWFLMFNGVLGILLGLFTIIVLMRDSVKEMFKRGELAFDADADHD
jgi:hypothetical protein